MIESDGRDSCLAFALPRADVGEMLVSMRKAFAAVLNQNTFVYTIVYTFVRKQSGKPRSAGLKEVVCTDA
jgi:hypothetical protein